MPKDQNEDEILIEAAEAVSSNAIRISEALGIIIQVIEYNQIIAIGSDNSREMIGTINKAERGLYGLKKV